MGTVTAGTNATATEYNDVVYLRNYIINGNFDICQRWGGGAIVTNPATNSFVLDRWKVVQAVAAPPSTINHSNTAITLGDIPNSTICYRLDVNGAGTFNAAEYYQIEQRIEHGVRLLAGLSKTVTLTYYARSSITSKKLGVWLQQNYGTGGSPTSIETITGTYDTLSSGWVKYTHTFTLNTLAGKTFGTNNDDFLRVSFMSAWGSDYTSIVGSTSTFQGSGTIDIAQVQLTAGDTSMEYKPAMYLDELRKCQRYCYAIDTDAIAAGLNGVVGFGTAGTGTTAYILMHLPVSLRTSPTLTVTADQWALWDGFSGAIDTTSITLVGANYTTMNTILLNASCVGGLTQYRTYYLTADGTARLLYLDAEL